MKIEVNIEKKYAFAIIGLLIIIASLITGYAFSQTGTGGTPSNMGHSVDEIDWSKTINSNVAINGNISSSGVCIAGNCKTDWNQVSGGARINSSTCYNIGKSCSAQCPGDYVVTQITTGAACGSQFQDTYPSIITCCKLI